MSSINLWIDSSIASTSVVGLRRTSSPYLQIGRTAKRFLSFFLETLDHRFDSVRRALLVEVVEHLSHTGIFGKHAVELRLVEPQQLGALRGGDRRRARFSGQHAHFSEKIPFAEARKVDRA